MRRFERWRRLISGIRFRLTVLYALVLGAVLLLLGVLLYAVETQMRQFMLDGRLTNQTQAFREGYDMKSGQITFRPDLNPELRLNEHEFLLLYNAQSVLVQQLGKALDNLHASDMAWFALNLSLLTRGTSAETFFNYPTDNRTGSASTLTTGTADYRVISTTFLEGNTRVATLVVGQTRDSNADLSRLGLDYAVIAPLMIVFTAGGAYWLAGRAMKPVRTISRTARTIGETDLSRRLNLAGFDEIAELAETFDGMLDRIEAAFDRQRQFTRDASHELRTPLTIVQLEVERTLSRPRTAAEYVQTLGVIKAESEYMARLVNNLLILARADSAQAPLHLEPIDLSDLALEVVERLLPLARQNNLELIVGALPDLPICGDRLYLTQMLLNLVENAVKYTGGVGQRVTVETGCDPVGLFAWAKVSDDGPGIAPEHVPHLFERFYRVDQVRSGTANLAVNSDGQNGSGLGLSIVQWVVQAHGGKVRVQSVVNAGAVFTVQLPLIEAGAVVMSAS